MFNDLHALPPDALLGITKAFNEDERADKVDLGVGVYRTIDNKTPIMAAVKEAQARAAAKETTKAYLSPEGAPGFGEAIIKLLFGNSIDLSRVAAIQTPGGCGALRLAAELLNRADAKSIASGTPSWANHQPLLSAAGHNISMIPYYDRVNGAVDFDAFSNSVSKLGGKDALLLHGGCHNPTGADLDRDQIDEVMSLAAENGFLPLVDVAYHGFADGLEPDSYLIRKMAKCLPEFLVTYSCSKNFGLYRERIGAIIVIGQNADRTSAMKSHVINIARQIYSMPPAHGGVIVSEILHDPHLTQLWKDELEKMRLSVKGNRKLLVETSKKYQLGDQLNYIETQNGMFSLLPVNGNQVKALRNHHGIYVANDGRANLCGVNSRNVNHICAAISDVIT